MLNSPLFIVLQPLEWKPMTGSLVITEDTYEMPHDRSFIRVTGCTVWLDTIQLLHHAVPGLSLFCL